MMFHDAFQRWVISGSRRFADSRTYIYQGKDVDQQVHLGFDLAVTAKCRLWRRTRVWWCTRPTSASTATA